MQPPGAAGTEDFSMTQRDILDTALQQSAIDLSCAVGDLASGVNTVVRSGCSPDARRYLALPFLCNFVTYGSGVVASVSEDYADIAFAYMARVPAQHLFETPSMHLLDDAVRPLGGRVCFMAEYFLPALDALRPLPCPYEMRLMTQSDFADLYTPAWSNALCETRRELDVLGVGAFDTEGRLIGLAGCSADCDSMWQIGIDVLPEHRREGIASALTSRLALEILERGRVPFYCAAWCNIPSVRSAVRAGFRPAWAEMTVKDSAFVDKMNGMNGAAL